MPKPYDSRTADKFVIRLPEGMREEIAERAKANGRSMNSEMVMMMREQLAPGAQQPEPLHEAASALIDLVRDELGERTQERRDQDTKDAIISYLHGAGLPHNAMEVVVRGRAGVGKTTVLRVIGENLQALLTAADLPAPPTVYLTMSNSTQRGLEQASFRHDRTIFLTDYEQESR